MTELEKSLKHENDTNHNNYASIYYSNYMDNKHLNCAVMTRINNQWEFEKIPARKNELLMLMCFDRWRSSPDDYAEAKRLSYIEG